MDEAHAAAACGWFGKIACLGDFGTRRLPADFVSVCDDWLSRGLAASRAQLGDDWLRVYLGAPLWRFAWAPGLAGPAWWLGVLMPSVDRVGRYFPLVAARSAAALPRSPGGLAALGGWLDAVADAALDTLRPAATLTDFEGRLEAASASAVDEGESLALHTLEQRVRCEAAGEPGLAAWALALGGMRAQEALRGHSLWLAGRAGMAEAAGAATSLSVAEGLPDAAHFVHLLHGTW